MKPKMSWILVLLMATMTQADAQQYVYPAKGQTPQQQKNDESACYTWAVQQTGFDPAKVATASTGHQVTDDSNRHDPWRGSARRSGRRRDRCDRGRCRSRRRRGCRGRSFE